MAGMAAWKLFHGVSNNTGTQQFARKLFLACVVCGSARKTCVFHVGALFI